MKEYPVLVDPEEGKTYRNRNGCTYVCTRRIDAETAVMVRDLDGWTVTAHRVRQYTDGTIEWDHSTGGYWPGGIPRTGPGSVTIRREGDDEN